MKNNTYDGRDTKFFNEFFRDLTIVTALVSSSHFLVLVVPKGIQYGIKVLVVP